MNQYLVGLALIEQDGRRIMPLGGKTIKEHAQDDNFTIEKIALEILLRLIQRSEGKPIRRINGEESLIIIQIEFENMQKNLPALKQVWIKSGDSKIFLQELKKISLRVWSMNYIRYEGIKLKQH